MERIRADIGDAAEVYAFERLRAVERAALYLLDAAEGDFVEPAALEGALAYHGDRGVREVDGAERSRVLEGFLADDLKLARIPEIEFAERACVHEGPLAYGDDGRGDVDISDVVPARGGRERAVHDVGDGEGLPAGDDGLRDGEAFCGGILSQPIDGDGVVLIALGEHERVGVGRVVGSVTVLHDGAVLVHEHEVEVALRAGVHKVPEFDRPIFPLEIALVGDFGDALAVPIGGELRDAQQIARHDGLGSQTVGVFNGEAQLAVKTAYLRAERDMEAPFVVDGDIVRESELGRARLLHGVRKLRRVGGSQPGRGISVGVGEDERAAARSLVIALHGYGSAGLGEDMSRLRAVGVSHDGGEVFQHEVVDYVVRVRGEEEN